MIYKMFLKIAKKIKNISLKFVKKVLKFIFKNNYPYLIHKIIISIEYQEFFEERKKFNSIFISSHSDIDWIIKELNQKGFCKINNFWSEDECIRSIKDVDYLLKNYPEYIHSKNKSDSRIFGAEKISDNIKSFSNDNLLISVANKYNKKNTKLGFTLAAKMPYQENSKGSGEGWHRDAFFRQFKALLYLNDVEINNGPFELILNSNKHNFLLEDIKIGNLDYMQYRLSDHEISKIISRSPQRKITLIGKIGTLILVDTSSIHRGSPIKEGTRYALTNYYYTSNQIDKALFEKFKVVQKVDI